MNLNYNYTASKSFAEEIGLKWLGDDYLPLIALDKEAKSLNATQEQVEAGMRHHLWQVKWMFTPSSYRWYQRLAIAFYFLTGWPK